MIKLLVCQASHFFFFKSKNNTLRGSKGQRTVMTTACTATKQHPLLSLNFPMNIREKPLFFISLISGAKYKTTVHRQVRLNPCKARKRRQDHCSCSNRKKGTVMKSSGKFKMFPTRTPKGTQEKDITVWQIQRD